MKFAKEEDMARIVVSHFETLGYQVYKEVSSRGGRLDIYCVKENDTVAIETKLNLGLTLLEQAHNWLGRANRVFLAIPYKKKNNLHFAREVCRNFGIGIMLVSDPQYYESITEIVPAAVCADPSNPPEVFEEQKLETFLDQAAKFKRPIIVGVLPLANSRHAEFLHNEVPGMYLPDNVRDRMRKAGEENGPKEGAAMARDTIALCREKAAGVYLVPSFGRYEVVAELVAGVAR